MIGILPNPQKPDTLEVALQLARWAQARGVDAHLPPEEARAAGHPSLALPVEAWHDVQACVVLGGDGTFLQAAKRCAPHGFPLLGVNMGRVGFLTEVDVADLYRAVSDVLAGRYREERRMMLQARVERGDRVILESLALNDVVVSKGPFARMAHITVYAAHRPVTTYRGDGLIVSTPTGSTAYALSAGGPLLSPELELMLVTPICPHSLSVRPLVLGAQTSLRIQVSSPHVETLVTVDGQRGVRVRPGDEVCVEKSPIMARLLRPGEVDFFQLVRLKFQGLDMEQAD
jgi:NAD+ kinase